jgi:hypothetical protein
VTSCGALGLVFGDDFGLAHDGSVHGVVGEVDEEGRRLVSLDEADGLAGEAVGEEFVLRAVLQGIDTIGREVARRGTAIRAADVGVEALLLGIELRAAEVPFADAGGGVASGFEPLGQGFLLQGQLLGPLGDLEAGVGAVVSGDPVGDVQPGGAFPCQNGGAGGRAHRAGGVGLGEFHPILRELVDVRRLVVLAAVAAEIRPAHVVDQHEDDVRRRFLGADQGAEGREKSGEEKGAEHGGDDEHVTAGTCIKSIPSFPTGEVCL